MSRVNLFDIGKAFYQRSRRDPHSKIKEEAYKISRELWTNHKTKKELLSVITRLKELQRKGQSAVYRVPLGQRGALAAHAERYVHIVCIDRTDNYSGRLFAFSEVSQAGQVVRSATKDAE